MTTSDAGGCAFRPQPRLKWTEIKTGNCSAQSSIHAPRLLTEYIPRAHKNFSALTSPSVKRKHVRTYSLLSRWGTCRIRVLDFADRNGRTWKWASSSAGPIRYTGLQ